MLGGTSEKEKAVGFPRRKDLRLSPLFFLLVQNLMEGKQLVYFVHSVKICLRVCITAREQFVHKVSLSGKHSARVE
jgi:hypothetical protein